MHYTNPFRICQYVCQQYFYFDFCGKCGMILRSGKPIQKTFYLERNVLPDLPAELQNYEICNTYHIVFVQPLGKDAGRTSF